MISRVEIENFRIFKEKFLLENLGIPDGSTPGSGMTVLLGENGCGKTSILDAIAVALNRNYAENFSFEDLRNKEKITSIHVESNEKFPVQMATQGSTFNATGFYFEGKFREVDTSLRLSKLITKKRSYKPVKGIAEEVNLKIDVLNDHGVERHSDFNILYLGKNRTSQIKPGIFNSTRFDQIMEDLDYLYNKNLQKGKSKKEESTQATLIDPPDVNSCIKGKIGDAVRNKQMEECLRKFQEVTGIAIDFEYVDYYRPHKKVELKNEEGIDIQSLGSGYEMFFSILYGYILAKRSKEQIIFLIDEPEMHLHPSLQEELIKFLLEASKETQVVLSSHSTLIVEQLIAAGFQNFKILEKKNNEVIEVKQLQAQKLPTITSAEVNFIAFDRCTAEYQNLLYDRARDLANCNGHTAFSNWILSKDKSRKQVAWTKSTSVPPQQLVIDVCLRHLFHYPSNLSLNGCDINSEIKDSIIFLRSLL